MRLEEFLRVGLFTDTVCVMLINNGAGPDAEVNNNSAIQYYLSCAVCNADDGMRGRVSHCNELHNVLLSRRKRRRQKSAPFKSFRARGGGRGGGMPHATRNI